MSNSLDDLDLLGRGVQGELADFDRFVDRYKNRIFRYLYVRIRNRHAAEDLTQEVFLRVFEAASQGKLNDANRSLKSWIFTIAHHCLIDHVRIRNNHLRTFADYPEAQENSLNISVQSDLELQAVKSEELAFTLDIMNQLPEDQRDTINLRILGGLDFSEIAGIHGCPVATVKSRLRYGLQKLREALAGERRCHGRDEP